MSPSTGDQGELAFEGDNLGDVDGAEYGGGEDMGYEDYGAGEEVIK